MSNPRYVEEGHLGGYHPGGDPNTFFPELWTWLVERYGVRSVLDVGCGEGHSLKFFRDQLGCSVYGVEGTYQNDPDIYQHDFADGPWTQAPPVDLIWSCEFVEHVDEEFAPNMIPTFQLAKTILMTHAFPGQPGHHHVNCRNPEYWIGFMAAAGFRHDEQLTRLTKGFTYGNLNPWNHYKRAGMAFVRMET